MELNKYLLFVFSIVFNINIVDLQSINIEDLFVDSNCIPEPDENFFTEHLLKETTWFESKVEKTNYRNELNLLAQNYKLDYTYDVQSEEGPVHERIFNISITIDGETYYGSGKSKQEAKEKAAKSAVENLNYTKPLKKLKNVKDNSSPPTVILNNLGARHGYKIDYYLYNPLTSKRIIKLESGKVLELKNISFWKEVAHLDEPPKPPFHIEVDIDGANFYGKGHTIQSARHDAASNAIKYLKDEGKDQNSLCTKQGQEENCLKAKNELKSPISLIYDYARLRRIDVDFKLLSKSGEDHKPMFEFECTLGPVSVTAEGKSKKEAKKNAAIQMLQNIPDLDLITEMLDEENTKKSKKPKKKKKNFIHNIADYFFEDSSSLDQIKDNEGTESSSKKPKKNQKKGMDNWSPKEKLIEFGTKTDTNIQFYTNQKKEGYYSVLKLDLSEKFICLGYGSNKYISEEYASLNALKFLYKLDLLKDVESEDLESDRFSFDNFIWLDRSPPLKESSL